MSSARFVRGLPLAAAVVAAVQLFASGNGHCLDAPEWPDLEPGYWKEVPRDPAVGPQFSGKFIRAEEDVRKVWGTREFHLVRTIALKGAPVEAKVQFSACAMGSFALNGKAAARCTDWGNPTVCDVTNLLEAGRNHVEVIYCGWPGLASGTVFELFVRYADGTFERFASDEQFTCNGKAAVAEPALPQSRILPYVDFSVVQDFVGATASSTNVTAGEKVGCSFRFRGDPPDKPFDVTISLEDACSRLWWDEVRSFGPRDVKKGEDGTWTLPFEFETPLYTTAREVHMTLKSSAVYCRGGIVPSLPLVVKRVESVSGYEKPICASVVKVGNLPQFAVNGRPFSVLWGGCGGYRGRRDRGTRHSDAPLNVVSVYPGYMETGWWPRGEELDAAALDRAAEAYRRGNHDAWFVFDLTVYPPADWIKANPDEVAREEDGRANGDMQHAFSFSSRKALMAMMKMVGKVIRHVEESPYANRVIGYRINSGHTIEWLGWDASRGQTLDHSPVARQEYAQWAKRRYPGLEDLSVPGWKARHELDGGELLWDPAKHLPAIAYQEYMSVAAARAVIALCSQAKKAVGGKKLIGTYYGYTMTLAASGSDQPRSHFGLKRVIDSGCVDFLMSPQQYFERIPGNANIDMKPFATLQANGIVPILEDDTRTHVGPWLNDCHQTINERQTDGIYRRNIGIAACRGEPQYYIPHPCARACDYPGFARDTARALVASRRALANGAGRKAEVALVVSERTITAMPMLSKYLKSGYDLQFYGEGGKVIRCPASSCAFAGESYGGANYTRFARAGAPVDYLLAEDLRENPGAYKLYVFVNQIVYDESVLEAVRALQRRDCTILWAYAPGYTSGRVNSLDNMSRLTGLTFGRYPDERLAQAKMTDGRPMGTPGKVAPVFYLQDAEEVLGTYEDGKTAVGLRRTGCARSVFTGPWQLDVPFISEIYRRAGVHVYSETSDPIEAGDSLVTLHARFPGTKRIRLRRRTDVVDVYNRKLVAKDVDSFSFEAELHSSWLFYCADDAEILLKELDGCR